MLISSNDFGSVLNSGGVMTTFSVQTPTRMNWVVQQIKNQNGQMSYPRASTPPSASSSFQSPLYFTNFQRDAVPLASSSSSSSSSRAPPVPSSSSRISPAVLFIIVILAVIFFISGLLHLLIRFLTKQQQPSSSSSSPQSNGRYPRDVSGSEALQRQLQQLFHLHDSGLDQAFIDALPVFLYKEIVGPKEPFDCAVCLCEFADEDKLRLLPVCSHAFHLNCIDTWLLSNSTCPLCRGSLFIPGLTIENPVFDFSDLRDEDCVSGDREDGLSLPGQKPGDLEEGDGALAEKKVFPVRLGKFRSLYNGSIDTAGDPELTNSITNNVGREEGESSSSSLDARRCYSMGSYQYVVGDSILKVALNSGGKDEDDKGSRRRGLGVNSAAVSITEGLSGKRLCVGNKGESFSVSKIWQWSNKKGKFPFSSSDTASLDGSLSWVGKSRGGDT